MTKQNHLVTLETLGRGDIEEYINLANNSSNSPVIKEANGKPIIALLFFEESTRTKAGFTSAAYRLGMNVITVDRLRFDDRMGNTESLEDTIRSIQSYCDLICLRHPKHGVFASLDSMLDRPIVNCGNGDREHPTQALIDLMTIKNALGRLDDISVAIVGNPRFSRSAHSLVNALSKFENITINVISPKNLHFEKENIAKYRKSQNTLEESEIMNVNHVDVLYVTGFPHKLPIGTFSKETQNNYSITPEVVSTMKDGSIILCPLPRIDEIDTEVDGDPRAKYFEESRNGLFMRMAILQKHLHPK